MKLQEVRKERRENRDDRFIVRKMNPGILLEFLNDVKGQDLRIDDGSSWNSTTNA